MLYMRNTQYIYGVVNTVHIHRHIITPARNMPAMHIVKRARLVHGRACANPRHDFEGYSTSSQSVQIDKYTMYTMHISRATQNKNYVNECRSRLVNILT